MIIVDYGIYSLGLRVNKPGTMDVCTLKSLNFRADGKVSAIETATMVVDIVVAVASPRSSVVATLYKGIEQVHHFPEVCRFPQEM